MRSIYNDELLEVPQGVTADIKSRVITVEGPRGKLTKVVRHINMDLRLEKVGQKSDSSAIVKIVVWHGGRKHIACLRTVKSLILNMIKGVTKGFLYRMRAVYAHFPINIIIQENGTAVEIRNFLGEKAVRNVKMAEGVKIEESQSQKDEVILTGNDIQNVSQSAASIQGVCRVRHKDIRKFLDGVYVSSKEQVVPDE
ncbi:hypothetical protein E3P77_02101 [Wallemia ichthyophaga]|uniref:Large ribosomal subunit protein uL6 alpha-beta domain-containing protein n=2 Tax=Wallemia ichthyophaga TaxID=245174 RepID=A0A4T0J1S6_WALIC|nr:60S ribosomal protein L9-A [Wallemia ichthyophaga EXF-994]TIA84520.1 hypothetical protein E3P98_00089 [Wallemia ichthyophaga]EOQ99884.1 60S ribosomal protein L9-A [Wallemia ichthyophaga EXF-994]TIA93931.1 hypothetical protein E3P97_00454 [Wallemia ichthyophaga]TIA97845.1 hypothetical protein E3P96_03308 [Wallemia ichthyophaga]TIB04345.1 hypothetical protein E3P95_00260 [Wallemia ichthyophaga]